MKYRTNPDEDFAQIAEMTEHYPYPIASACNIWMNQTEPAAEFQQGLKAAEAVASFLAIVVLSELRLLLEQKRYSPTPKLRKILFGRGQGSDDISAFDQVSFGKWVHWAKDIFGELKDYPLLLSQVPQTKALFENLGKMVELRNKVGHGKGISLVSEEKVRMGVRIVRAFMKDILKSLLFLKNCSFTYVEKILLDKKYFDQTSYIHVSRKLKGHLIGKPVQIEEPIGQDSDSIIFEQRQGQHSLSLFPFLIYSVVPTEDVYFYAGGYKQEKYEYLGCKHSQVLTVQYDSQKYTHEEDFNHHIELNRLFTPSKEEDAKISHPDINLAFDYFLTMVGISSK